MSKIKKRQIFATLFGMIKKKKLISIKLTSLKEETTTQKTGNEVRGESFRNLGQSCYCYCGACNKDVIQTTNRYTGE